VKSCAWKSFLFIPSSSVSLIPFFLACFFKPYYFLFLPSVRAGDFLVFTTLSVCGLSSLVLPSFLFRDVFGLCRGLFFPTAAWPSSFPIFPLQVSNRGSRTPRSGGPSFFVRVLLWLIVFPLRRPPPRPSLFPKSHPRHRFTLVQA